MAELRIGGRCERHLCPKPCSWCADEAESRPSVYVNRTILKHILDLEPRRAGPFQLGRKNADDVRFVLESENDGPTVLVPLAIMEAVYRTLSYYGNLTTYQAPRIGGVLQGCPRGKEPAPDELVREALTVIAMLDQWNAARGVRGTSPPEDSYPDQSILHDEANVGNCLQATIAGVLDWPLESVPHFALLGETHWWDCAQAWLDSQGYWIDYKPDSYTRDGGTLLPRCWLSGQSPRGFSHAVIGDTASGQVLHDPHPTRAGLVAVDYTIYFFRKPSTVFRQPAAGVAPAAPSPIGEVIKQVIAEGGFPDPGAAPSAQLDADVARLMAMTEPEIDAELRSMGMDPGETAARGRRAVERALTEIRERNAGAAPAAREGGPVGAPVVFRTPLQQGLIAGDGQPCPNDHDPACGWPECNCRARGVLGTEDKTK